jgi:hypothetical protein
MDMIPPSLQQQNQDIQNNVNQPAPSQPPSPSMGGQQAPSFAPPPQPDIDVQHDTMFGRAAKALMGNTTSYSVDENGKTVATETPQKPGQFWKSILAAAVLGGAAGGEAHARNSSGGFMNGLVAGGASEIADQRQQDMLKRQQAEQEFQRQQEATKSQREARAFETQEKVRQAQIAQANAETLRTNMLTQGENYATHSKVADAGKQHFADYDAAGLQPVFKNIPESEMHQTIQNRQGASAFDWEPAGVKISKDAQGQPTYEYTYSAYDPKGKVPVSAGTIEQWKKDGMDKFYPELFNILKPGKELGAQEYIELKKTDSKLFNDQMVRDKANRDNAEGIARVNLQNAEAAHALAESSKARFELSQAKEGKTQQQAFSIALQNLNDAGGDFTKLAPKDKILIGESTQRMMGPLTQEIAQANQMGDFGTAHKLMLELDQMRSLSTQAMFGAKPEAKPSGMVSNPNIPKNRYDVGQIDKAVDLAKSMPKEQAVAAINSASTYSEAEKLAIIDAIKNPKAPTFGDKMSDVVQNSPNIK